MGSVVAQSQARDLLKALADPLRLQIIESLSNGEKCVCDLIAEIDIGCLVLMRKSYTKHLEKDKHEKSLTSKSFVA